MSKFAKNATVKIKPLIATRSSAAPDTVTYEGGAGFSRDEKSELFLLAITNMVGENTFYEKATDRDARFESLIHKIVKTDPSWIARFVPYLRNTMNMRSASLVMAAEYVRAGGPNGRKTVVDALVRADEPAEMLGYWLARYGRKLPKALKRGLADATERLYNERNVLKYDGEANVRMSDVLEFAHPKPIADWQNGLFGYLIATRHKRDEIDISMLPTITAHKALGALPQAEIRELMSTPEGRERLAAGGWTWEALSSKYGKLDARFWEAMIPNMGIFALVRNLRNFDDAGINDEAKAAVIAKLTDPKTIEQSRMFPLRFYSAWKNTGSTTWGDPLDKAINLSLANVPALPGRTLVLVDVSGSMSGVLSANSKVDRAQAGSLFGAAVASRAESATLVAFESTSSEIAFRKGDSVLRIVDKIGRPRGGTDTWGAVQRHFKGHDRIVIVTDEQAHPHYGAAAPDVPIYTFNVAGYKAGHIAAGSNRHTFGGLSDAGFTAIALLERNREAAWPF